MDIGQIIYDLREELRRIEEAISSLEKINSKTRASSLFARPGRGRKSMSPAERREVSDRMRKYWADRKKAGPQISGADLTKVKIPPGRDIQ